MATDATPVLSLRTTVSGPMRTLGIYPGAGAELSRLRMGITGICIDILRKGEAPWA